MNTSGKRKICVLGTVSFIVLSVFGTALPANAGGGYIPPTVPNNVNSANVQPILSSTDPTIPGGTTQFSDPTIPTVAKVGNKTVNVWNGPTSRSPRSDILYMARRQIGYTDTGVGANSYGWSKYGAWYSNNNPALRGTNFSNSAWCAMFTSWVYAVAGYPRRIETRKGMHLVNNGFAILERKGKLAKGKRSPYLMDLMSIRTASGHVGLGYGMRQGKIVMIEGNMYDKVSQRWKVKWNLRAEKEIINYGSPL